MIVEPLESNQPIGRCLKAVCKSMVRSVSKEKNDDFFLLIVGDRSTGKSMLALHIYEQCVPNPSIDFIALNREQFGSCIQRVKDAPEPRFVCFDEGNVNKKETMTQFNRELIDLYYSIRQKRIIHVWCNPTIEIIDKRIVIDLVSGMILTISKGKSIRSYYYFSREGLLRFFDKYKGLELRLLRRVAGEYAMFQGWYKDYHGKMRKPYDALKENRMNEKMQRFGDKWGEKSFSIYTPSMVKQMLMLHHDRAYQIFKNKLLVNGKLVEGVHIFKASTPKCRFNREGVEIMLKEFFGDKYNPTMLKY